MKWDLLLCFLGSERAGVAHPEVKPSFKGYTWFQVHRTTIKQSQDTHQVIHFVLYYLQPSVSGGKLWDHFCVTSAAGKHAAVPLVPFSRRSPLWGTSEQPGTFAMFWNKQSSLDKWGQEQGWQSPQIQFLEWKDKKSLSWLPLQRNPSLDLISVTSYKGWRSRQVVFKRKAFEICPEYPSIQGRWKLSCLPSLSPAEGGSTVVSSVPDLGWALWFVCGLGGCFWFLNNL